MRRQHVDLVLVLRLDVDADALGEMAALGDDTIDLVAIRLDLASSFDPSATRHLDALVLRRQAGWSVVGEPFEVEEEPF